MTQLVPALTKAQPLAKTATVQGNYAAGADPDAKQTDYADLQAGLAQQASQADEATTAETAANLASAEVAAAAEATNDAETAAAALSAGWLLNLTGSADGVVETTETTAASEEQAAAAALLAAGQTDIAAVAAAATAATTVPTPFPDTKAALNLSYSFAGERSIFYSTAQANGPGNAVHGTSLDLPTTAQNAAVAATVQPAALATLGAATPQPQPQLLPEPMLQQHNVVTLQGTSLQQFIRQALGSAQALDNSTGAGSGATATAATTGTTTGTTTATIVAAEQTLSFKADLAGLQSSQWGQKLAYLLADKINLQMGQQIQRAQIRLDPPLLGVIELSVSVDGDRTSVQLYAANSQIRDAMQQNLDQLRQQLAQRLGAEHNLDLDVRDQAQQQGKDYNGEAALIAAQPADDPADTNRATALQQTTGWLDRLV